MVRIQASPLTLEDDMFITLPPHVNIPRQINVACSGGADSMALLHFMQMGRKDITVVHVHHGTAQADMFHNFVENYCLQNKLPFQTYHVTEDVPAGESKEFFWAAKRYEFFNSLGPIVTGSHLDDAVETWLMSCLRGQPKIPAWKVGNVLRPFLLTKKDDLYRYCQEKNVPYIEDESNLDTSFMRNAVRHKLVKNALEINPGLYTTIREMLKLSWNDFQKG